MTGAEVLTSIMGLDSTQLEQIRITLRLLRSSLTAEQQAQDYLKFFDEFLQQDEFELALHCVCDYLFEADSPPPQAPTLEQIDTLHITMGITDDCVERIRRKSVTTK